MKKNLPYIIILTLTILHALVYLFDKSNGVRILNWTMLLSFIYFMIFGLVRLFQTKYNDGIISLFSAIIILTVELKLWFYYYNYYLNLIVLFITAIIFYSLIQKFNVSLKRLKFPILFLVISFILNQISDLKVFQHISSMVSYQSLDWNDFQGKIENDSEFDATIKSGINFKTNYASNPTQYLVFTGMIPEKSWVKRSNEDAEFEKLLNHEQRHFDIVKIHENLLKDSLRKVKYDSQSYEEIIKFFSAKEDTFSRRYDEFTSHGFSHSKQRIWNNKIDSILELQKVPLLSGNDKRFREAQGKAIQQAQLCMEIKENITELFNARNEFLQKINSTRESNKKIETYLFERVDSLSNELLKEIEYSILKIENRKNIQSDKKLYKATLNLISKIKELELVFQPFFNSIKTSNSYLEEKLGFPVADKASKIKMNYEIWESEKDDFLTKYELSSDELKQLD